MVNRRKRTLTLLEPGVQSVECVQIFVFVVLNRVGVKKRARFVFISDFCGGVVFRKIFDFVVPLDVFLVLLCVMVSRSSSVFAERGGMNLGVSMAIQSSFDTMVRF